MVVSPHLHVSMPTLRSFQTVLCLTFRPNKLRVNARHCIERSTELKIRGCDGRVTMQLMGMIALDPRRVV
jgi:hypothetical protein